MYPKSRQVFLREPRNKSLDEKELSHSIGLIIPDHLLGVIPPTSHPRGLLKMQLALSEIGPWQIGTFCGFPK